MKGCRMLKMLVPLVFISLVSCGDSSIEERLHTTAAGITTVKNRIATHEVADNAACLELEEKFYELKGENIELRDRVAALEARMLAQEAITAPRVEAEDYEPIIEILRLFTGH